RVRSGAGLVPLADVERRVARVPLGVRESARALGYDGAVPVLADCRGRAERAPAPHAPHRARGPSGPIPHRSGRDVSASRRTFGARAPADESFLTTGPGGGRIDSGPSRPQGWSALKRGRGARGC